MGLHENYGKPGRRGRVGEVRPPSDGADLSLLEDVLAGLPCDESSVIPALQRAQEAYGYLPKSVLARIADTLGVPWAHVYGVATFYAQFHLEPRGRHTVTVCRGTACHVGRSAGILRTLCDFLGIAPGETTSDLQFTLETVACLGACALAPVVVLDGVYYGKMTEARAVNLITQYCEGARRADEHPHDENPIS